MILGGAQNDVFVGQVFDVYATTVIMYGGEKIEDEEKICAVRIVENRGAKLSLAAPLGMSDGKVLLNCFGKDEKLKLKMRFKKSFVQSVSSNSTTTNPNIDS
ncbi:MAG: hypothetical protein AAF960_03450 [Bacteroidota bacterium]